MLGSSALEKIMKLALIFAALILLGVPGLAAPIPCPTNTPLSTFTPPPDSNEGCLVVNNTFVSFAVPQAGVGQFTLPDPTSINGVLLTANTVPTPTPAQIFVMESPDYPGSVRFSSPGPSKDNKGNPNNLDTNSCTSSTGSLGWCIQGADQVLVSSFTYVGNYTNAVSLIGLTGIAVSHSSGGGGATAVVFREFCPDTATFAQGCANYGVLQGGAINGNFNTLPFTLSLNLATATTQVAFRDTVFLDTNNGTGSFAAVMAFDLFTPEPATFWLLGTALVGLGFARFRRKRV